MTDIFLGLGKLFTWSFGLIEFIGYYMGWILFVLGSAWFFYFTAKIFSFGKSDERYKGDFK